MMTTHLDGFSRKEGFDSFRIARRREKCRTPTINMFPPKRCASKYHRKRTKKTRFCPKINCRSPTLFGHAGECFDEIEKLVVEDKRKAGQFGSFFAVVAALLLKRIPATIHFLLKRSHELHSLLRQLSGIDFRHVFPRKPHI